MQKVMIKNFENVFIMLYKSIKILLLLVILTAPISASSEVYLDTHEEMIDSLDSIKLKIEKNLKDCEKYESRVIDINNNWFLSLDKVSKGTILLELNGNATNNCFKESFKEYNDFVIKYTIITDDRSYLDKWLKDNSNLYLNSEGRGVLNSLDQDQLIRFLEKDKFKLPFDMMGTLEKTE